MNNITFNLFKIVTVAQLSNWAINYVNIQNFPFNFGYVQKINTYFYFWMLFIARIYLISNSWNGLMRLISNLL